MSTPTSDGYQRTASGTADHTAAFHAQDTPSPDQYGQAYGQGGYGDQSYPGQYGSDQYGSQSGDLYSAGPVGYPACPSPHGGWAAAAILFFWPLAFVAVGRAFDVYPLWAQGRFEEARRASDKVAQLGKLSLWLFVGLYLGMLLLYIAFIVLMVTIAETT